LSPTDPDPVLGAQHPIRLAARRINGHVNHTPLLECDLHRELRLKLECWQVSGSFKARGAFNALLSLDPPPHGVVTVSSGNHGQAVALAARTLSVAATVVIPEGANPYKVESIRGLGAEVVQSGVTFDNRMQVAQRVAHDRNLVMVHPYDDWDVIHGQGTVALEMLEQDPRIRTLVAPVGGGGLLSGTSLTARALDPEIKIVGVEPAGADDAARSLASGRHCRLTSAPATSADGLRSLSLGDRGFAVLVGAGGADAIVTVDEEQIGAATALAWTRLKLALEPSAALPLAAFSAGLLDRMPAPWGLILSGGNFDPAVVAGMLGLT